MARQARSRLLLVSMLLASGVPLERARADEQSFEFGARTLTNLEIALSFSPTIGGTVRGVYVSGTWSPIAGVNDAGEFRMSVDGPGGADLASRQQGGSGSTPFTFGAAPRWWSNGQADNVFLRYRGEYIGTTAPASAGPWTVSLRNQGVTTRSLFSNTRVNVLTDAAAPWSGSIAATSQTSDLPFALDAITGAGITSAGQYRYQTMTYVAQATGMHLITSVFGDGLQGRLHVYEGAFDPAIGALGVIGVDTGATAPSGITDNNSAAIWIGLTAGRAYTLVVSAANSEQSQGPGRTGNFFTSIAGGAVPAPGSAALALIAASWSTLRRRSCVIEQRG